EEDDVVMGEGVVVTSSSLEMLTMSCLGGIMLADVALPHGTWQMTWKPEPIVDQCGPVVAPVTAPVTAGKTRGTSQVVTRGHLMIGVREGSVRDAGGQIPVQGSGMGQCKGSSFELTAFSDADHAGCIDSRKSTSGGIQFLGDKLVSWMSKKHNCTAMSSAEAEYVALSASCAQVMWMRTQLQDYGFNYNKIPSYCDS
nr:uncharacterized mitochondrial protein AtMg00810-like [Tanacetum cinerariifolium]